MAIDENNSQNETKHKTKDKIAVAEQKWHWDDSEFNLNS